RSTAPAQTSRVRRAASSDAPPPHVIIFSPVWRQIPPVGLPFRHGGCFLAAGMKILVADKISPKGVAFLRQQPGFEVVEAYGSSPEKILELVRDVHAIAVRSETKITAAVFAAAPQLK